MRYKEDWESAKKRHTAFWNHDIVDRCCISVHVQDKELPALMEDFKARNNYDFFKMRTDPERLIESNRLSMEHSYYGGDSFPRAMLDLGASGHAGFFKDATYQIEDTVWFFPSLTDPDSLEFDENSFLYRKTIEIAKALVEDSRGDYFVCVPDATGNADAMAHLMGSENFMEAMLDEPEAVKRAMDKVQFSYEKVMREVYDIVRDNNEGGSCVGWLRTWAPGFHAQMQCDMSVMISNPMFKEFIMPELQAQCNLLEYPLYHFDGVEQLRHLDDLLSLPGLRTIQWTQVVGQDPCTNYIPELKRIQKAGKNLLIIVEPEQIRPILENLSSRGLYLLTSAPTKEDADAILKEVSRLTRD